MINRISILMINLMLLYITLPAQVVHTKNFDRFTNYKIDDWITYAPATHITSIDVGDEFVYFGTPAGGILRYNVYEKEWEFPYTTSSGLRSNQILDVVYSYEDNVQEGWESRVVYALTDKGIDIYDPAFDYWSPAYIKNMPPNRRAAEEEVREFRNDPNLNFPNFYRPMNSELPNFFAQRNYLFRPPNEILDEENRVFYLTGARVVDFHQRLWIGTNGLGVASSDINDLTLNLHLQSITNISPHDVYYDGAENKLWIGGHSTKRIPAGIVCWDMKNNTWQKFEAPFYTGLYSDKVNAIAGNDHFIFFGTNYGLVRYTKKDGNWTTYTKGDQLESDEILDLEWFGDTLFIATAEGFNWTEPPHNRIVRPGDRKLNNTTIYRLSISDSLVYMASRNGIYTFDLENKKVSFLNTGSAILDINLTAIQVNQGGDIWTAGQKGIINYSKAEDKWQSFPDIVRYIHGKINDIQFTKRRVWFATDDGLLKYEPRKDYWYLYTTEDGLPSNKVFRVDPDGKNLWLSTAAGMTIFRWKRKGRTE